MSLFLCAVAIAAAPAVATSSRAEQIEQARAALAREDNEAAVRLLEQADRTFPGDAEILRLLGSSYAFARRYPEAIATLRRAEALAPNDLDIGAALARAYLWSGDRPAAAREVALLEQRSPGNPDAAAIRRQLQPAPSAADSAQPPFGLAVAQSLSHVSFPARSSRTWSNTSVALFGRVGAGTTLAVTGEREDRRTAVDTRMEARLDQSLAHNARGFIAFAATPRANFRERWGVTGGVEFDVSTFATLVADLRHAEYRDASVTVFQPGARFTARALALDATIRMINLWDEQGSRRSGVSGRLDRTFPNGAALYAGAATYPDTEAGITRQVHSFFAGGTLPVSRRMTLRAGVDYDRRRQTYTRKGASLGIQFRF